MSNGLGVAGRQWLIMAFLLPLVACGKGKPAKQNALAGETSILTATELQGVWSECKGLELVEGDGVRRLAVGRQLQFDGDVMTLFQRVTSGTTDCYAIGDTEELQGTYVFRLGEGTGGAPGSRNVGLETRQSVLTLFGRRVTDAIRGSRCGFTDWRDGQAKDITGRSCVEGDPAEPRASARVVWIQDGKLYMDVISPGQDGDEAHMLLAEGMRRGPLGP